MSDGKIDSPISKFFTDESLEKMIKSFEKKGYKIQGGQTILAIAGDEPLVNSSTAWLRSEMGDTMGLKNPDELHFAWIIDFPMYEWDERGKRWDFGHNPFSMVQGGVDSLKNKKHEEIFTEQYDLVCNGYELASGSIRNYNPEVLVEAFKKVGYTEERVRSEFEHIISAFEYGAPPHGGFAVGFDRLIMLLTDEKNIREVYAFPKSNGKELMSNSPRGVSREDLDILHLEVKKK